MRILRVGDPHVRPSNLEESERLMNFVMELAIEQKVDRIELLGDLFHTHAILRLEVIEFWNRWLKRFARFKKTYVLVGNHDLTGDFNSKLHALGIFMDMDIPNLTIVDNSVISGPIGYMPYVHKKEDFIHDAEELHKLGAKVLVCHATIDGSKYESGMYAPDGMPMLPQFTHVISGHIHSQQEFGNVIYPGTSRWDTSADANQAKGIWIYEHDPDGRIVRRDFFTAERVCSPIFAYVWKEGDEAPQIPENCRASLEAIGTSDFCAKAKAFFKGKVGFRSKITDQIKLASRESGRSLEEFLTDHYPVPVALRQKLLKFMKELKLV